MFSSCIFQASISIGTFVSNSLSLSTTDGTKWTSFKYDWGIWWKTKQTQAIIVIVYALILAMIQIWIYTGDEILYYVL